MLVTAMPIAGLLAPLGHPLQPCDTLCSVT